MLCNTNPFFFAFCFSSFASGGCHVSILLLEMHSCYTPFFLHLHCAHDDSMAYTLSFALALAFPFVFHYT